MQSGAKDCYIALQGDEARGFFSQAVQYELPKRVQLMTEIVAQDNIRSLGKIPSDCLDRPTVFTYDIPQNKEFAEAFLAEYKEIPDWTDGEMYQALMVMFAENRESRFDRTSDKVLYPAMENLEVTSVKGPVLMRKCDHQGENQGFVVKVAAFKQVPRTGRGDRQDLFARTDHARLPVDELQRAGKATRLGGVAKYSPPVSFRFLSLFVLTRPK